MPVYAGGRRIASSAGAVYVGGRRAPSKQYQRVLDILGPTGIIIPIGAPEHENPGLAQVETVGESRRLFTYGPSVFDTKPYRMGPGQIPIVTFNGTDEGADAPDAAYWSPGNGTDDSPFSVGIWVNTADVSVSRILIAKFDQTTGDLQREWLLYLQTPDGKPYFTFVDESVPADAQRRSTVSVPIGSWTFIAATYDGRGGAACSGGVKIYQDGALVSSSTFYINTYVAMENLATLPTLGYNLGGGGVPANFFEGEMAGGSKGPISVQRELTPGEVSDLYDLGKGDLGL